MDTKLKKGKKIRALLYRALAAGALFSAICSAIIGKDAFINLKQEGIGTLSGDIYYLSEFRDYITALYMQGMIGYAGLGDNNGYPLTTQSAKTLSRQAVLDFRANAAAAADELIYRIEVATVPSEQLKNNSQKWGSVGLVKESSNVTYPLFSEYDGHLLLPKDSTLCCYWNGYTDTLNFLAPKHLESFYATQLYKPNEENSSQVHLILAVKNKKHYTSEMLAPMSDRAKGYQRVIFLFFGSCISFVSASLLCFLSRHAARPAKAALASRSINLWLEVKLLFFASLVLFLSGQGLLRFAHPVYTGYYTFRGSPILYLPVGCILYLLYADLLTNGGSVFVHSLTYRLACFIRSYFAGKSWQRKMLNVHIIILLGALASLGGGSWILYVYTQKFIKGYYTPMTFLFLGVLLIIIGLALALASIRLKHFLRDSFALTKGLDTLQAGTVYEPLVFPRK